MLLGSCCLKDASFRQEALLLALGVSGVWTLAQFLQGTLTHPYFKPSNQQALTEQLAPLLAFLYLNTPRDCFNGPTSHHLTLCRTWGKKNLKLSMQFPFWYNCNKFMQMSLISVLCSNNSSVMSVLCVGIIYYLGANGTQYKKRGVILEAEGVPHFLMTVWMLVAFWGSSRCGICPLQHADEESFIVPPSETHRAVGALY